MADTLYYGFAMPMAVLAALYAAYHVFVWIKTPKFNFPVIGSALDSDFADAALEGFEKVVYPWSHSRFFPGRLTRHFLVSRYSICSSKQSKRSGTAAFNVHGGQEPPIRT